MLLQYFSKVAKKRNYSKFLQKKASFPPFPYCHEQFPVKKEGKRISNVVGEVKKYFCKDCKKYFLVYPEKIDKDAGPCPECKSYQILHWGFFTSKAGNRFKTWK